MTPEEALERMEMFGGQSGVPQIYADMGITRLRILIAEKNKPPRPSAMDRMPVPRLNYNPLDRALGRETPPAPAAALPDAAPPAKGRTNGVARSGAASRRRRCMGRVLAGSATGRG